MSKRITGIACVAVLALAIPGFGFADASAQDLDIQGTWIRTSDDGSHQRGLLLFTPGSYSMMVVAGGEPRPEYQSDSMNDREILAAYGSFIANAGRYTLEGNRLIREAYMAKDPNYMAAWPDNDQTWTLEMDGPNRLITTDQNGVVTIWTRPTANGVPVR